MSPTEKKQTNHQTEKSISVLYKYLQFTNKSETILTCTMSEQANSTHLTDNLSILNFRVLQCKAVASLVQQTVAFVLEPVKSKLIISQ